MVLKELDKLFRALDIDNATPDKYVSHDLGMDYEGRLCFREDIENSFHIVISDDDLKNDLTVLELGGLISRKLLITPNPEDFGGKLSEDIAIMASDESVYRALLDVSAWPRRVPGIRSVSIAYDDNLYQEFTMDVETAHGGPVSVRSVRRCERDHIAFFLPKPPCFLKHQCGDWFIRPLAQNATHLTIVLRWTLSAQAEALLPQRKELMASQQVASMLRENARIALSNWKRNLEDQDDVIRPVTFEPVLAAPHSLPFASSRKLQNDVAALRAFA